MNSKEALEELKIKLIKLNISYEKVPYAKEFNIIKQDLDRLEELKKENSYLQAQNKGLREMVKIDKQINIHTFELIKENNKLKKVIEILKDNYPIKFLGFNKYGAKPYEIMVNGYIQGFEKEQYELLKEVLEND